MFQDHDFQNNVSFYHSSLFLYFIIPEEYFLNIDGFHWREKKEGEFITSNILQAITYVKLRVIS